MQKTIPIQMQELRDQIAADIQALDLSANMDGVQYLVIKRVQERCAAIAKGNK